MAPLPLPLPHPTPCPREPNTADTASCALRCAAGTLCLQLSCSALYHVGTWERSTRTWLRRLDHAAIFTLIAGTYTPLCLLALDQVGVREFDDYRSLESRVCSGCTTLPLFNESRNSTLACPAGQ